MSTCRDVAIEASQALKALAPGDDMQVDESTAALRSIQQLLLEAHEARGPLTDVDVAAAYTAGENERIRIEDGASGVYITLPNAIAVCQGSRNDYGFASSVPPVGIIGPADGRNYRAPRDGDRIEIVGTSQALFFYRADINQWASCYGLALDDTLPLNARYVGHFGALVAERMIDTWPALFEPTPSLAKRIGRANLAMNMRTGVTRPPVRADYF